MRLKAYIPETGEPSSAELLFEDVPLEAETVEVVESVELEPVIVDDNEPIADMSDARYWAEVRIAGSMAEVERQRIDMEGEIDECKGEVTTAEAELNVCRATLNNLREQLSASTDRLLGLARKLVEVSAGKSLPTESDLEIADTQHGWRLAATADLMRGLKGLSKKKLEMLVDYAPTAGHLEDLRGLASSEFMQYHEKLPAGIGVGVAGMIEDRVAEHVRRWMDRLKDPAREKLAKQLLAECRDAMVEWSLKDCEPKESDDEHLHAGFTAFGEGMPPTEFLSDDRAKAKQWITGWVSAERLRALNSQPVQGDVTEVAEVEKPKRVLKKKKTGQ